MAMTLITTNTGSGVGNSAFTSSIDSTYKLYIFKFIDVNPATDEKLFGFNGSTDSGSNYNVTKTTTYFRAIHQEDDGGTPVVEYHTGLDLAQATGYQTLTSYVANDADSSIVGTLWLFNPSNTTYVKHFYSTTNHMEYRSWTVNSFAAGYFNTTSAIDAVDFKMDAGNMDAIIKMYGVS